MPDPWTAHEMSDAPTQSIELRLHPGLRAEDIRPVFARFGRVHVPGVLDAASARALATALAAGDVPWQMHFNDGDAVYDVAARDYDVLAETERAALRNAIWGRARAGFQYCFDNFSLSDARDRREHLDSPLLRALEFMQSGPVLEFARRATGLEGIRTADAQATRYRPGDFLTAHDDRDESKGRLAAYVLNMTPTWRTDWGGLLQFIDADGHVAEAYAPAFNALNIFRVPQPHAVSLVAPFAGHPRLSVAGWFRS
jgi:hypothetical protein